MTSVRLKPAAPLSRVKHSTTESLRSLKYPDADQLYTKLIYQEDTCMIKKNYANCAIRVEYGNLNVK